MVEPYVFDRDLFLQRTDPFFVGVPRLLGTLV
jgi:hypothetical protein